MARGLSLATRSSNSQLGVQGVPGVDGSESLMLEMCLPDLPDRIVACCLVDCLAVLKVVNLTVKLLHTNYKLKRLSFLKFILNE